MTRSFRFRCLTTFTLAGVTLTMASPARAAYPVTDVSNIALNTQQLARQAQQIAQTIEQIQNQVQSLENQARMLEDLEFSNYREAIRSMRRIRRVLRRYCAELDPPPGGRIGFNDGFNCRALIERFRQTYPAPQDWSGQSDEQIARYPDRWNAQRRDVAARAMQTQSASVEAMAGNAERMAQLADASKDASGQKAAIQVTNEMLVTLSAQLRDQQATAVASQRGRALEQAEKAAWHERNQELIRRVERDADTDYDVQRVHAPFTRTLGW